MRLLLATPGMEELALSVYTRRNLKHTAFAFVDLWSFQRLVAYNVWKIVHVVVTIAQSFVHQGVYLIGLVTFSLHALICHGTSQVLCCAMSRRADAAEAPPQSSGTFSRHGLATLWQVSAPISHSECSPLTYACGLVELFRMTQASW